MVDKDIKEEIKWKAPSFNDMGEYLVTFNFREEKRIHLVFHNPQISKVKSKLLENVGVVSKKHQKMYVEGMSGRFKECIKERTDI